MRSEIIQHLPVMSCENTDGQVEGMGNVSLFTATPYATPSASIPL